MKHTVKPDLNTAITIIGSVIAFPRLPHNMGIRAHYKTYLYQYILWKHDFRSYRTHSANRSFARMSECRNVLHTHITYLCYVGLLYQCKIPSKGSIYTTIPYKYKHWYTCDFSRFVRDIELILTKEAYHACSSVRPFTS